MKQGDTRKYLDIDTDNFNSLEDLEVYVLGRKVENMSRNLLKRVNFKGLLSKINGSLNEAVGILNNQVMENQDPMGYAHLSNSDLDLFTQLDMNPEIERRKNSDYLAQSKIPIDKIA